METTQHHMVTEQDYLPSTDSTQVYQSHFIEVYNVGEAGNFFIVLGGLLIAVENALAITAIWRTPRLNTNENIFIASLCLTDFTVGIIYAVFICINVLTEKHSFIESNIISFIGWIMCTLSAVHLALVGVDRAICITKPFFYEQKITRKFVVYLVLSTWVAMALFALVFVIVFIQKDEFNMKTFGYIARSSMLFPASAIVGLSCVITIAAYVIITCVAVRHRRAISALQVHNQDGVSTAEKTRSRVMKTVKFFTVVCGAFFACVSVFLTVNVAHRYVQLEEGALSAVSGSLPFNSAMNTVTYAVMNKTFRRAYVKLFVDFAKTFCPQRTN